MNNQIEIKNMHFYWRMNEQTGTDNPFPDFFPVTIKYDKQLKMIRLNTTNNYWALMSKMYGLEENVGYLQDGHDLAPSYGNEFLDFVVNHSEEGDFLCDIGAGGLYVLNNLRKRGYKTLAVDPSIESRKRGEELKIEVISHFYEEIDLHSKKIDSFIHYDVLEHVEKPDSFLKKHFEELSENGKIIFAVPDCSISILNGDISMLLSQHVNYFDEDSLAYLVISAGFTLNKIEKSKNGGVLFCFATKNKRNLTHQLSNSLQDNGSKYDLFFSKYEKKKIQFEEYLDRSINQQDKIGLYIPLRIFPYLSNYLNYQNFIFIDDSKVFQNKYFDGFNVKVQNFDYVASQIDKLIVFSPAFGNVIKNNVQKDENFKGEIFSWDYHK